jgi:hypothetical protein
MRSLRVLAFLLFALPAFSQTVTVSGKITDGAGNPISGSSLRFELWNCGANFPRYTFSSLVIVKKQIDFKADVNGNVTGKIIPNDEILCGNVASTRWLVTPMKDGATPLNAAERYNICSIAVGTTLGCSNVPGQTFDAGTSQPDTITPPAPGFTSIFGNAVKNQTWNQPLGTTAFFFGTYDFTGATVLGINGAGGVNFNCSLAGAILYYSGLCDPLATLNLGVATLQGVRVNGTGPGNIVWTATGGLPTIPPANSAGWGVGTSVNSPYLFLLPSTLPTVGQGLSVASNPGAGLYQIGYTNPPTASLGDPGANGVVFRSSLNITRVATSADLIALWTGTCDSTHALFGDGTCKTVSAAFSAITSGVNTTANMQNSTGSSLSPLNIGQVAGSQMWLSPGIVPAAVAISTTGGSILNSHGISVQFTFVSAAGETTVSATSAVVSSSSCSGGNSCSVTVTAPTIPAGYTGYTVYANDASSDALYHKQTATGACVNITGNCVITAVTSSGQPPTTSTAYIQPPNIQANTLVPHGGIPGLFFPKADGNYYPLAGMDFSVGTPLPTPDGTFEFWHRFFVTDSNQNITEATQAGGGLIRNALVSFSHIGGNGTTKISTDGSADDRVIAFRGTDQPTGSPWYHQWLGIYGEQFIYNNNFNCQPVGGPMVGEDCVAAVRVRTDDQRTAGAHGIPIIGLHATAATDVASPAITGLPAVAGIVGTASQETVGSQNGAGLVYAGVVGSTNGSAGNTNGQSVALYAKSPTTRFATQNMGVYLESGFSSSTLDFAIRSDATAKSKWMGSHYFASSPALVTDSGTLGFLGSVSDTGSINTVQLAVPTFNNGGVANIGTPGSTTYTYKVMGIDGNGQGTGASAAGTTTTGNATLDTNNFNRISVSFCSGGQVLAYTRVDVYRTVGGATQGKIGSINPSSDFLTNGPGLTNCSLTLDDKALAGDGATAPTQNATGGTSSVRYDVDKSSTLITGDFTLGAGWGSTAATAITVATSKDQASVTTITTGGTGIAANPTYQITFHNGTWLQVPVCAAIQTGGNDIIGDLTVTARSATAYTFQWNATPTTGKTYEISIQCMGT